MLDDIFLTVLFSLTFFFETPLIQTKNYVRKHQIRNLPTKRSSENHMSNKKNIIKCGNVFISTHISEIL